MTTPIISVIIPLYNKSEQITRAIDSVISQTIQNFEIIIVNDGSTDGGDKKAEQYNDSRIHVIHQENQGVSIARNNGVKHSNAELITFLDADDEWLPEYLETILRLRNQHPNAGLYTTGWYTCTDSKLNKRGYYCFEDGWEGVVPRIFRTISLADGATFPGNCSSTMVPKNIFLETGGFREGCSASEDIDLWARISLKYQNVHIQRYLSIYHLDDSNSLGKNITAYLEQHPFEKSLDEMAKIESFSPSEYSDDLKLYLDSINIIHANNWISYGDKIKALKYILKVRHLILYKKIAMVYARIFIPNPLLPIARKVYSIVSKIPS